MVRQTKKVVLWRCKDQWKRILILFKGLFVIIEAFDDTMSSSVVWHMHLRHMRVHI